MDSHRDVTAHCVGGSRVTRCVRATTVYHNTDKVHHFVAVRFVQFLFVFYCQHLGLLSSTT